MLSNEIAGKATTRTATYGPFAGVFADLGVGSHPPSKLSPLLIAESWGGVPGAASPPACSPPVQPPHQIGRRARRSTALDAVCWAVGTPIPILTADAPADSSAPPCRTLTLM